MQPRAWFGVAVRVIGLWLLVRCVQALIYAFNLAKGLDTVRDLSPMSMVNYGVAYVAIGLVLIRFAPLVVSWAYPGAARTGAPVADDVTKEDED